MIEVTNPNGTIRFVHLVMRTDDLIVLRVGFTWKDTMFVVDWSQKCVQFIPHVFNGVRDELRLSDDAIGDDIQIDVCMDAWDAMVIYTSDRLFDPMPPMLYELPKENLPSADSVA